MRWDLLLVGLLVSPGIIGGLFLQTMWGLLTVEIVPVDQNSVPIPSPGDRVELYGTWVLDRHYIPGIDWNEIHPAVFLRNLDSGISGGRPDCKLLAGVHDPERLKILDSVEPCRWARGRVSFVFQFADGDWHVDLRLEDQYQYLANSGPPLVELSYPMSLALLVSTVTGLGSLYAALSLFRPERTLLGRLLKWLRHHT